MKTTQPFQLLDDKTLLAVAGSVTEATYPAGSTILQQDGPPSEYLRLIKKGGVKVYIRLEGEEDVIIDYRAEGDSFGYLSLVGGDRSRANVVAYEDTSCYLIDKKTIQGLMKTNPEFSEFFYKSFLNKYIDKTYKEMHNKSLLYGGGEKLLFTTPVGELASREIITAGLDRTIRESAELMSQNKVSCLVLLDPDNVPTGIVTDRDLREKVVAKARSVSDPVSAIMSVPLMKIEARDYCFEAVLKMIRYNIHHLLVVDDGRLKGIVTNHDLMILQGTSPISIARDIEAQQSIEGLVPVSKKINKIVALLLKEGARASNITRIISEINDRMVRRVIEIAERKFGAPPLSYCWIAFGSEGRKEQTFKTDQDNAIIYENPATDEDEKRALEYFSEFTVYVRDSLVECGFPLCPANYMASNPKWCQPLKTWESYFARWINSPSPESVLHSLIFFDFRPLSGNFRLAENLRGYLERTMKDQNIFLARMASVITNNRPPIGFFRTFVVEKSGEHKDQLDLKLRGVGPMVDLARLFALESGVHETSTLERIKAMKPVHPVMVELGDELEQAFEFVSLLRIHHQMGLIERNLPPDNFINPNRLSNMEKKSLRESFQLVLKIQDAIVELFRGGMVGG